jgi:DNA-binding Lrp family transcriptional regulator
MPIEIDPNTDSDPIPVQPDTNEAAVLEVLAKHPQQAFTQAELAERAGVKETSVYKTVDRLTGKGLARRYDDRHYYVDPDARDAIYHRLRSFKRRRPGRAGGDRGPESEPTATDWGEYDDREKVPLPDRERAGTAGSEGGRSPTDAVVEVVAEDLDESDTPTDADDWGEYDDREKDPLPDPDE